MSSQFAKSPKSKSPKMKKPRRYLDDINPNEIIEKVNVVSSCKSEKETIISYTDEIDGKFIKKISSINYEDTAKELNCYELIPDDVPVKMYFDIDYKKPIDNKDEEEYHPEIDDHLIERATSLITDILLNMDNGKENLQPQFCIKTSHSPKFQKYGDKKQSNYWAVSIHIIVVNYILEKKYQKRFISKFNEAMNIHRADWKDYMFDYEYIFDDGVYDKNRKIRSVFSSKPYENRPFILKQGTFEDSVISAFIPENAVHIQVAPELTDETNQNTKPISNNNFISDKNFEMVNQFIEQGLLSSRCEQHESWVKIGIHFKTTFGYDKALQLFGRLTLLFGSENKKNEYEKWFKEYIHANDDSSKALNVIKKYARECDASKYKSILKNIETENLKEEIDELKKQGKSIVNNDKEASDIISERLKPIMKYCNNTLYLKENNVWRNDNSYIQDWLLRYILNSEIYKMVMDQLKSFVQDLRGAKSVREIVISSIRLNIDDDFANKLHTTTRGRLCFVDGVLDFETQRFYLWDKIDFEYYSCIQIPMKIGDYISSPNIEIINTIKNDILEPVFGKDINRALHFFSRAMSGFNQDKNYGTFNGNRDCGKGILYALFESFGTYLKPFELSNVLVGRNDNKSQETSRMTYWLMDYEFCRLAFTQETPNPEENLKINGRLFKKINSGGDTQTARRNYDREDTRFIVDFTMFIAGNNPLKYTESDCKEHEIGFTGIRSFKTQAEIDDMKSKGVSEVALKEFGVKDFGLKDRVKTDEYKMAFIYLIFSSFKSYPVSVKYIADDDDDETSMPLSHKILRRYVITNDMKNDKVGINDINIAGTDSKKIALALESMGISKKKWSGRDEYRNKWVYVGIRTKTEEELAEGDGEIDDEEEV